MSGGNIAFIGTAGIPNRYGGFESFLEHCAPVVVCMGHKVTVSCDARLYPDKAPIYRGVQRRFLSVPANGGASILHDLLAFFRVFASHRFIVVLGVSGGAWFPLFRVLCDATGKRLIVNVDGVEWRRSKFGPSKRALLKLFDAAAQRFAHHVIYDSEGLREFLLRGVEHKASCIGYPGDHVKRLPSAVPQPTTALTICRIEPENNLDLLIRGALNSRLLRYTIVGNWQHSDYARSLRERYKSEHRLQLLDPIYDADQLASLRESCEFYLHGHSVGGTNPSLVEMLFYDSRLLCFDVSFNRHTAQACAQYFSTAEELAELLDSESTDQGEQRSQLRSLYSAERIAQQYLAAIGADLPSPSEQRR